MQRFNLHLCCIAHSPTSAVHLFPTHPPSYGVRFPVPVGLAKQPNIAQKNGKRGVTNWSVPHHHMLTCHSFRAHTCSPYSRTKIMFNRDTTNLVVEYEWELNCLSDYRWHLTVSRHTKINSRTAQNETDRVLCFKVKPSYGVHWPSARQHRTDRPIEKKNISSVLKRSVRLIIKCMAKCFSHWQQKFQRRLLFFLSKYSNWFFLLWTSNTFDVFYLNSLLIVSSAQLSEIWKKKNGPVCVNECRACFMTKWRLFHCSFEQVHEKWHSKIGVVHKVLQVHHREYRNHHKKQQSFWLPTEPIHRTFTITTGMWESKQICVGFFFCDQ